MHDGEMIEEKYITEVGTGVVKRYERLKFLGRGGFAKCYKIKDLDTKKIYAMKIIDKSMLAKAKSMQKLASEISIHRSMNHHNVVHFERNFEDSQNAYILIELCPNKTLKNLVKERKRLNEAEARYYMGQLIEGVKYIHSQDVIHRDLKLDNLFLGSKMELKIGDFGLAAKIGFTGQKRKTICGTPNYIAPEVLNAKLYGYSFECDIWSMGVILYAMVVGKTPFESKNLKVTYNNIKSKNYIIPEEANLSTDLKELISELLTLNPAKRSSLDSLIAHSFMAKVTIPTREPKIVLVNSFSPSCRSKSSDPRAIKDRNKNVRAQTFKPPVAKKSIETKYVVRRLATEKIKLPLKGNNRLNPVSDLPTPKRSTENSLINGITVDIKTLKERDEPIKVKIKETHDKELRNVRRRSLALETKDGYIPKFQYIQYYQDYTSKYGLGYLITNGRIGFYYNDITNILWIEEKQRYGYSDFYMKGEKSELAYISEDDSNKDIVKKIKIFNHFKEHCEKRIKENKVKLQKTTSISEEISIKRIIKTKGGLLLRLTNGILQMIFADRSQIVICLHTRRLVYIYKGGEKKCINIVNEEIINAGTEIIDKYKYVLNVVKCIKGNKEHISKDIDREEMH